MIRARTHGTTLIDVLVGIAIMGLVFVGVAGVFRLTLDTVTNDKARTTAVALAIQRLEYVHSLAYTSVGMQHGIPSGVIPETETFVTNGVPFTRRTFIEYDDDPRDGLGAADTNNTPEDYKMIKVDVSWSVRGVVRHVTFSTRLSPPGLENAVSGGTLSIIVTNAAGVPLPGATVHIVNSVLNPSVDETLLTDASGTAIVIGAPTSTAYQVSATEAGYSTAQTYSVTAQNTAPTPLNLTVTNGKTTASTFAIDLLGSLSISTWTQILAGAWSDQFSNTNLIATMASTTVSNGTVTLTNGSFAGTVLSLPFGTSSIASWGMVSIAHTTPSGTSIVYQLFDTHGTLIPDTQLPGNSAGFATTTINLSSISTSTYPLLALGATLTTNNTSTMPFIDSWSSTYTYGPFPIPNVSLSIQGAKTIGSGPGGAVYKFSTTTSTGASAAVTLNAMEWDTYTTSVNASSGYDAASVCMPQPQSLAPGGSVSTTIALAAHTNNSLLVDVHAQSTGAVVPNAQVTLTLSGVTTTKTSDQCGQVFYPGLSVAPYSLTIAASGHATTTIPTINVSGTMRYSASIQ